MALYRANFIEALGLFVPDPTANVQRGEMGFAVDVGRVDPESGQSHVVYSWNRNIHRKDLATQKPGKTLPQRRGPDASDWALKTSTQPFYTKAYKDGLEYVKAEDDYRSHQKYLDSITPSRSRRPDQANLSGTVESTSGLPVPDRTGHVFHYPAETTASTGMMFEAPQTSQTARVPSTESIGVGTPRTPVILTGETEVMVSTGVNGEGNLTAPRIVHGTGVVLPPPIQTPRMDAMNDVRMPGEFPYALPDNRTSPLMPAEPSFTRYPSPPEQSPPVLMETDRVDRRGVDQIIHAIEVAARIPVVELPAQTPFVVFRAGNPPPPGVLGKRHARPRELWDPNPTEFKKRRLPSDALGKRRADPRDINPRSPKTRRIEEDVEDITLHPYVPRGRRIDVQVDADNEDLRADPAPEIPGVRPLAALRGRQPLGDYAIARDTPLHIEDPLADPTVRLRKRQPKVTRPNKKQRTA